MCLIIGPIGAEHMELFALELGKIAEFVFVYSLVSTNIKPISTKLGHNVHEHKILDEFGYGSSRTRSVSVICPWNRKIELQ